MSMETHSIIIVFRNLKRTTFLRLCIYSKIDSLFLHRNSVELCKGHEVEICKDVEVEICRSSEIEVERVFC